MNSKILIGRDVSQFNDDEEQWINKESRDWKEDLVEVCVQEDRKGLAFPEISYQLRSVTSGE